MHLETKKVLPNLEISMAIFANEDLSKLRGLPAKDT
jgi:hypothetical protein